jgi:ATP-binding cassette, subfamily C (CFTR/MRP), member 1
MIDMSLPISLIGTVITLISCIGQAVLVAIGARYISPIIVPLLGVVFLVQLFYLRTSRQLRYLDIEAKAPLFTHFLETINGAATIRAYGWTTNFDHTNKEILEDSQRPYYLLFTAQRWLNLILDLLVAVLAFAVATVAIKAPGSNSTFIGVALVNIVGFGTSLNTLVSIWTTLEMSMGAVTRVREFTRTTDSEDQPTENVLVSEDWPHSGCIEVTDLTASYK